MTCNNSEKLPAITVAVDGHSSCGKSTLAKDLAALLDYIYIDTGSMYRAITLKMINKGIHPEDKDAISHMLEDTRIEIKRIDDMNHLFLDGVDVEKEIRTPKVASFVSPVACIPAVRRFLVKIQREFGKEKAVVMEGRDIATVVFPNAELKLFVTADLSIRAERRHLELLNKGIIISREEVEQNLSERDHIDSNREDSPLRRHKEAILIDTSNHNRESQAKLAYDITCKKIMALR